jgi:UDP-glucose 4-epimerase
VILVKVLILGGAGFIGSNVSREFLKSGMDVVVVDGFLQDTGANSNNLRAISEDIVLHAQKVEALDDLPDLVSESDIIVDAIGMTSHLFGMKHPFSDLSMNLLPHLHLIQALKNAGDKKVIYLGSRSQYGKYSGPAITEETPQVPVDVQGVSKTAAEGLFRIYAREYGFRAMSLRITNCYGEHQKTTGSDIGLVGMFIREILSGNTVEIFGDAQRKKNLIYVKDLAKIIVLLSRSNFDSFEALNVAGNEVSLDELLRRLISVAGSGEYRVVEFDETVKNIDTGEAAFDGGRLMRKLGNIDMTGLGEALENTVTFFKNTIHGV